MTHVPAPDLDKIRSETSATAAAATITAVHVAYLTAAAVEDATENERVQLQNTARQWLENYRGAEPITDAYLQFLRSVRGRTWQPGERWRDAIAKLAG